MAQAVDCERKNIIKNNLDCIRYLLFLDFPSSVTKFDKTIAEIGDTAQGEISPAGFIRMVSSCSSTRPGDSTSLELTLVTGPSSGESIHCQQKATQYFTVISSKKHWPTEGLDEPQSRQKESKRSRKIEGKGQVPLLQ